MEGESGVPRSIFHELYSWDIQEDQMEGESGATRSINDELHSPDIQRYQMEGKSGVTRSIIDKFVIRVCNEIKGEVKVVLL